MDLFAYVAYFIKTVGKRQPPFEQVKADIQRLISESESCVNANGFSREDADLARFAVFAWIDEMILKSQWKERRRWVSEKLQYVYFDTGDAGEVFFERLNKLGPHQMEVREIYYLCLSLGFMGRYVDDGDRLLLEPLKSSNLKLLMGNAFGPPSLGKGHLFPEAYRTNDVQSIPESAGRGRFTPLMLFCIGFPAALYVALFFIYRFVLSSYGS
jgi:type VI secretion system protein ImpK